MSELPMAVMTKEESERRESDAFIKFEMRPQEDRNETIRQGRPIYKDIEFALITPRGGAGAVFETEVDENIKMRFRRQYEAWKSGQELPVVGTHLKTWGVLSPAQVEMLARSHIRTVEELAECPDDEVQRLFIGGLAAKQKAIAAIKSAGDSGKLLQEVGKMKAENDALNAEIAELRAAVNALKSDKPKPGRKKKAEEPDA